MGGWKQCVTETYQVFMLLYYTKRAALLLVFLSSFPPYSKDVNQ